MNQINKETYYKLPTWFLLANMTLSRSKNTKYKLTQRDNKNGFFIPMEFEGITLKVPMRSLFDTNKKLDGIPSLSFSTAKDCPSYKMGCCQLCDKNLCYAMRGEKQASGIITDKGFLKLNSYYKSVMDTYLIEELKTNNDLFKKLIEYINLNFSVMRFNKKGDFKNASDILFLFELAYYCPNVKIYGYTARDDLFKNYIDLSEGNIYINGSNVKYSNRFKTITNLKEYLNAPLVCLGDCNKCGKCYTLRDKTIICLLHGSLNSIDAYFNTFDNREFLIEFFNNNFNYFDLTHEDLKQCKGLLKSLNKKFANSCYKFEFANYKELTSYIKAMGWG